MLSRAWGFDDVHATEYGQRCPSGAFKQSGWNACMLDKLDCLMRLPMDGQRTLYVDSDVALMPGLHRWAERQFAEMPFDGIAMADDVVQLCAGVMLFRSTSKVHAWWRLVASMSQIWDLPDQDVIDQLRRQAAERSGALPVPISVIPGNRVCNWATLGNRTVWAGEPFVLPETCLAWHANWVVGVDAKDEMLRRVVAEETHAAPDVSA